MSLLIASNEVREKALVKMLKEMELKHTSAEESIHNWLSNQDDPELLEGILKEDRTINGALKYAIKQAEKQKDGNTAVVDDQTVFGWVKKYYTAKEKQKTDDASKAVVSSSDKSNLPKRKEKNAVAPPESRKIKQLEGEQLNLLDFL